MKLPCILFLIILCTHAVFSATKVACIGNSITSGYGATGFSYVTTLQTLLGSGHTVQNFGVSGTTLLKKGDNPYWNTAAYQQALASQADIFTIKLGTNDTKTNNWDSHKTDYKKDYLALLDSIYAHCTKKPLIYPVFPIPLFNNPIAISWGMRDTIISKYEIPVIKEICTERGLTWIDANTPLLPFANYFSVDGVHPNKAAADTIAAVIYRALSGTVMLTACPPQRSCSPAGKSAYTIATVGAMNNTAGGNFTVYSMARSLFSLNGRICRYATRRADAPVGGIVVVSESKNSGD